MSTRKVRVLHDFEASPDSHELPLTIGEVLSVLKENSGDGWLEGENSQGAIGFFPDEYVEPLQPIADNETPIVVANRQKSSTQSKLAAECGHCRVSTFMTDSQGINSPSLLRALPQDSPEVAEKENIVWSDEEEKQEDKIHWRSPRVIRAKTGRNINRFTSFVRTKMEAYVLGESAMKERAGEKHKIIMFNGIVQWNPVLPAYTCTVANPKKESKMRGFKSFIAYTITSTLSPTVVSRRHKHFDWLYERLRLKYCLIAIPPLPEKQLSGRFEEELIDHRKHILQIWVDKICRHPVLSQSEVWLHFITISGKKDWKDGKRKAEKDEYVGGNFLHCVKFPARPPDGKEVELQLEMFAKDQSCMEEAIAALQERLQLFQKLYKGPVLWNWEKMASSLVAMGHSYNQAAGFKTKKALNYTAQQYRVIGKDMAEQTSKEIETLLENLFSLKGTIQGVPDILNVHKKIKDNEGKLPVAEEEKLRMRVSATSYAVLAEINHLEQEKMEIIRSTMSSFLTKQGELYQRIAEEFAEMSREFD